MSCLSILLLTTGCFQPAGEGLQATSVAQGATFTPSPSPTLEPPTEEATELFTIEVVGTPTPEAFGSVNGTELDQGGGQEVAQAEDPGPGQTATAIIIAATERAAFNLTQTAEAFATPTPTLEPFLPTATPTLDLSGGVGTGGPCTHVVQQGENLFRLSLRYNVPVQTIATANNILNINIIKIGDTLNIPGCNTAGGDFGTGGPIGSGQTYTVMQGDTLFKLSMQYGVTVHQIAAANGIPNINLIYIGQQLVIPPA
jgi:LysM repeat protein